MTGLLALLALVGPPGSPLAQAADPVRFVVLGHIRGKGDSLSPKLPQLLDRVRPLHPDFVVLTGDIIWGDVQSPRADTALVIREWERIDSAVATLGVPVWRVPGNHDISDRETRDVWNARYGRLPAVVDTLGVRLLLLASAWIPADDDTRHNPYIRGVDLDSAQVAWLRRELAGAGPARPTFAFMHHLLWWEPEDGPWWRDVHPILAGAGVDAVFSGDYGPLKFSALEKDGVRYFQSSIELPVSLQILRNRISSRILSAQFDNFFEVVVGPGEPEVIVHTLAEVSSAEFTPERYAAINEPGPPAPLLTRIWDAIGSPKRLVGLGVGVLLIFGLGFAVGRRR